MWEGKMDRKLRHVNKRRLILAIIDIVIFVIVYVFFAKFITISVSWRAITPRQTIFHCGVMLLCIFGIRFIFGLYIQIWRYANVRDYLNLILADIIGGCLYLLIDRTSFVYHLMVSSTIAIVCSALIVSLSARFIYQRYRFFRILRATGESNNRVNVAVVGAGLLGAALVEELQANPKGRYRPICFIDSNPEKAGSRLLGLPVYGEAQDVVAQVQSLPVQDIIIAIDSLSPDELQTLYNRYRQTDCKVKVYAHPLEATDSADAKHRIRELQIEDLLYRDEVALGGADIRSFYHDKVVLITGGGGSIGSELARQVAKFGPKSLIILDIYENNANDIQQELQRLYGSQLEVIVEIASVRDQEKVEEIFARYRPNIVFHAAAHKHVHLMEHCQDEAIKNNIFGTYNAANAAEKAGVEHFILISTDKAVNPTNMMGATKRLCEMIIQSKHDSETRFAAVRFGNVLGSNGSVIPLFKRQIEEGGPVTITDKRIIRYFMTIPEAAQLLLQTGAMAHSGEIFVLDMGKPVKILDLAENMIRLSGLVPDRDIEIREVGLRPGEKLYEELLMKNEELNKTASDKIFVERDTPITREQLETKLNALTGALAAGDAAKLRPLMMRLVPTYRDAGEVNARAMEAEEMGEALSVASGDAVI